MKEIIEKSRESGRKRAIHCFHKPEDKVQRMLNAIQPGSYLPPHKHLEKTEVFLALKGKFIIAEYDDSGNLTASGVIADDGEQRGVEVAPNVWHNIISLEPDSVAYEVIDGPYLADQHKVFPGWAPKEGEYVAGMEFIDKIKKQVLG